MSDIPPVKQTIQIESSQTRDPVGESLVQALGGDVNILLLSETYSHTWKMNGPIKQFNGQLGVDGIFSFRKGYTYEIIDVIMYGETMGASGTVEIDLKYSTFPSGTWTSIFSTTPKITSSAAAYTTIGVGDTVSGATAPILTSAPNPLAMSAKTRIRMDIISMQAGTPKDFGIEIIYQVKEIT